MEWSRATLFRNRSSWSVDAFRLDLVASSSGNFHLRVVRDAAVTPTPSKTSSWLPLGVDPLHPNSRGLAASAGSGNRGRKEILAIRSVAPIARVFGNAPPTRDNGFVLAHRYFVTRLLRGLDSQTVHRFGIKISPGRPRTTRRSCTLHPPDPVTARSAFPMRRPCL
jgi:hypothetical protein